MKILIILLTICLLSCNSSKTYNTSRVDYEPDTISIDSNYQFYRSHN